MFSRKGYASFESGSGLIGTCILKFFMKSDHKTYKWLYNN